MAAVTGTTDCYGKQASELGTTSFEGGALTGTLNYVTDYMGFNASEPAEQTGYFLPFTIDADNVQMNVIGEPVTCDKAPTVNVVFLGATKDIAEKATLKLVKDGQTTTVPMTGIEFGEATTAKAAKARMRKVTK